LLHAQRDDVGLERMQARGTRLDEVRALRPAGKRLEAERAGAGKEVEDARVLQLRLERVEQRAAHMLGRGPHAEIVGAREVAPLVLAPNDPHGGARYSPRGSPFTVNGCV